MANGDSDPKHGAPGPGKPDPGKDEERVVALRARSEEAFRTLVETYHPRLQRLAAFYVRDARVAEDVVQDTWIGVLQGIDRFEGRSSLKSWIYSILIHKAKSRGVREARTVPFSALAAPEGEIEGPVVEPERFLPAGHRWAGHWQTPPRSWGASPAETLLLQEGKTLILGAIAALPESYREVITLRDVEGLSGKEVCNVLGLTETNQRVLLHRARSRVRRVLEDYFAHG